MASDPEQPDSTPTTPTVTAPTGVGPFSMFNLARGAKLVALLLFLLPWVTVSCAEQTLASMSGLDLATGSVSVSNPMTGATERPPGTEGPDMPVLAAAILIALGFAATFVLARGLAVLIGMASAAVSALLISYTVLVHIPDKTRQSPAPGGESGGMFNEQQMAEMIRTNIEIGFWLTLAALVAAIALYWMARSRSSP